MPKHRCIISLGSNHLPQEHLKKAWGELLPYFTQVNSSPRIYTDPINFPHSQEQFLNQILDAYSCVELPRLQQVCKAIERTCGRTPEQKERAPHLMPLDIDIVVWDTQVLKPHDFERPYLLDGLQTLGLDATRLRERGFGAEPSSLEE